MSKSKTNFRFESKFEFEFKNESKIDVKVIFAFEIEYLIEIAIEAGAAVEVSDIVEIKFRRVGSKIEFGFGAGNKIGNQRKLIQSQNRGEV